MRKVFIVNKTHRDVNNYQFRPVLGFIKRSTHTKYKIQPNDEKLCHFNVLSEAKNKREEK
jgi:hypothetical protein